MSEYKDNSTFRNHYSNGVIGFDPAKNGGSIGCYRQVYEKGGRFYSKEWKHGEDPQDIEPVDITEEL